MLATAINTGAITPNTTITAVTQTATPIAGQKPTYNKISQNTAHLNILQFNCNGIRRKIDEILNYMETHDISIAAIQETKLSPISNFGLKDGYSIVREDRDTKGGGIAFVVHDTIKYRKTILPNPQTPDAHLEQMGIAIKSGLNEINLVNVYIPPQSGCSAGYKASIAHLLDMEDGVIMGDFNAHNELWHSQLSNDRGDDLADQIDATNYGVINEDTYTRLTASVQSSPDITIVSHTLIASTEWKTDIALSSDHLPIVISLGREVDITESEGRTFMNFLKADWEQFTAYTEKRFERIQRNRHAPGVHKCEKWFREVLTKATKQFIPSGRIPLIKPNFPSEAIRIAKERDDLRVSNPGDPRIITLSNEIVDLVRAHKKQKWIKHLDSATFTQGPKNLWKTIRGLTKPNATKPNSIISFDGKPISDEREYTTLFNKQFTEHPLGPDKAIRRTLRKFDSLENLADLQFDIDDVRNAIKKSKASKALGPDNLAPLMLKKLGAHGLSFLTTMINKSLSTLIVPNIWKRAKVIPLLKPGKPPDESTSYRPISLLSPVAKLIEQLIAPSINNNIVLATHQHGFRKGHSTTTALHLIHNQIQAGLNQKRPNHRTVMVALDLSKAFDTVSTGQLLDDIERSRINVTTKRWLRSYIRGRYTYVEFRNNKSRLRKMKQGVPQGSAISPTLFNLYMSTMPLPPDDISLISYADDCTILATGPDFEQLCDDINVYLATLNTWFTERGLQLSTSKSTATLFTTWTKEVKSILNISINGSRLPTIQHPKILGITFDPLCTFNAHAKVTKTKLKARNNVLKSLAGSNWGKEKETLLTTHKSISKPILNYAAPIWSQQLSMTNWTSLQTTQNAALRMATGCHLMAHEDHLHQETETLPTKTHAKMLSQQYLVQCFKRDHPCNKIVHEIEPPRHIRKSIGVLKSTIEPLIRDMRTHPTTATTPTTRPSLPIDATTGPHSTNTTDGLNTTQCKQLVKLIHTNTVRDAISASNSNMVLGTLPPPISDTEKTLPRVTRTTLSQLRSGRCKMLNNYMHRINQTIDDACPRCSETPHDTQHLFNCNENPTAMTVSNLWTNPVMVATFLGLEI